MKRKAVGFLLVIVSVLTLGSISYAATSGYTMKYLPGTSDAVTNMPADDNGTGGAEYTVSDIVPQRDGYEFIDWTLDYELARKFALTYKVTGDPDSGKPGDVTEPESTMALEGSDVPLNKLSSEESIPYPEAYYVVHYLERGTNKVLHNSKYEYVPSGTRVTEHAEGIYGYKVYGNDSVQADIKATATGQWDFIGWCSDEECTKPISSIDNLSSDTTLYGKWKLTYYRTDSNDIYFYYDKLKDVKYTVRCIDIMTGEQIAPDEKYTAKEGETVTVNAKSIDGYLVVPESKQVIFEATDDHLVLLLYFEDQEDM